MDLFHFTAPTVEEEIAGQRWTFSALTWRDNEELQSRMIAGWQSLTDIMQPKLAKLTETQQMKVLELCCIAEMKGQAPSNYDFELWKRGPIGGPQTWWYRLRKAHPDMTLEQADILFQHVTSEESRMNARAAAKKNSASSPSMTSPADASDSPSPKASGAAAKLQSATA